MSGALDFRSGLFVGVAAAALGVVPACFREGAGAGAWFPLTAAASFLLGPLLGGLGSLWRGGAQAPLAALGLSAIPLAGLLALLQRATHHRPLGAVVFSLLALSVVAGATLTAWRALDWASASRSARRLIAGAAALGPLALLAILLSTRSGRVALFDGALVVGLSALLVRAPRPEPWRGRVQRLAVPLWLLVTLGGVFVARGAGASVAEAASPALFAPLGWIAR